MHASMACRRAGRYGAPMATTRDISYEADGRTMVGTLALPDDGDADQRPGVLVCHEGPGLDDHARARAARLADELGYVAFALDYHGGGKPITDRERDDGAHRRSARRPAAGLRHRDGRARHPAGRSRGPTPTGWPPSATASAARLSLELARGGADLKAVVGFHSGPGHRAPRGRAQHHRQGAGV